MPKLTIYLPDEIARAVGRAARNANVPVSRWVAARLTRYFKAEPGPGILNAAGAIPDFPWIEEIRSGYALTCRGNPPEAGIC